LIKGWEKDEEDLDSYLRKREDPGTPKRKN
jgi:hypothetical protein